VVEVLAAYQFLGLVLISDAVILIALLVFGGPTVRPYILAITAIMIVAGLTLAGLVVSSGRGALQNGIVAEGEVLAVQRRSWPSFGQHGLIRVDARGRRFEAEFAWGGSPDVEPGQRLQVLIGPKPDRVADVFPRLRHRRGPVRRSDRQSTNRAHPIAPRGHRAGPGMAVLIYRAAW
jgi:hypothetical protein